MRVGELVSIREAYGKALVELGEANKDVVVLDADVSKSTRSALFGERFPERFFNVGIAEANMMAIAAGLASCGKIPFANTFSFLACLRAGDQVRSLVAYSRLNVKVAAGYGGLSDSYDGPTHQSVFDLAIMRAMPNMTVMVVADAVEARKAVFAAAEHEGPVFLRLSRAEAPVIFDESCEFEIGKANVMREGRDITIIATGVMVGRALEAARSLEASGIDAGVIEVHTLKPLDDDTILEAARITGAVVTAEEHSIIGGLGGAVAELLGRRCPVPLEMVGIQDTFAESGGYEELLEKYGLGVSHIVKAAERVLARKRTD